MGAIVGVHGVAQQRLGRHRLRPSWSQALADGMERALGYRVEVPDLDVAFYGDLFLSSQEWTGNGKGIGDVVDDGLDPVDAGDPDAVLAELDDDEAEFVLTVTAEALDDPSWASADQSSVKAGFPRMPERVLAAMAALDRRFGHRAGSLFVGELRQVRRYLTDPDLRSAADARVDAAVSDDCRVLIGHSLGSIVALERVRRRPERRLELLLTLGSPLGLRAVRSLLPDPAGGTDPERLAGVARWVNLRDARDPVAMAGDLGRWWPGVVDDATLDNGRSVHAAVNYLGSRQAGSVVCAVVPAIAS